LGNIASLKFFLFFNVFKAWKGYGSLAVLKRFMRLLEFVLLAACVLSVTVISKCLFGSVLQSLCMRYLLA